MNEKWFALSIGEIEKKLKTNAASGLSRKAARSAWHKNFPKTQALFKKSKKTFGKMVGEVIGDFSVILLMLAATLAVLFAELFVGVTVLLICAISFTFSIIMYFRAQRSIEKMNLYFLPTAKVIRGGRLYRVSFENVVVGDVIILERGDVVCADARLVTSEALSVSMRTGKNSYVDLKKQAHGAILENTADPKKMVNIVHAGSVVESGSGRAIVYSVGKYTYLGALTGGIIEPYIENIPSELKKMKRICSKMSFISMLCILPFSVVSLLLSHLSGGTTTLSATFLTALAISASSMTQLSCTLCKIFFVKKIKDLAECNDPIAIRTTDAFDKLSGIDYLFMLDGSALTDGVLHFDSIFNADGEIKNYDYPTASIKKLLEMVALYNSAEANSLTIGLNLPDRFKASFEELFQKLPTDAEALKIKYPIKTYMTGNPADPTDSVYFSDNGKSMILSVSQSVEVISQCSFALTAGNVQPLSSVTADKIKHTFNAHTSKGKTVLAFSLTSFDNAGNKSGKLFLGALVLSEKTDNNAVTSIDELRKRNVNVISFVSNSASRDIPQIPLSAHLGARAYKHDFTAHSQPLTYRFGEINTYYGFDESDIALLLKYAHSQGKTVAVLGFSDYAPEAIKNADVFISCSSIIDMTNAKSEKELYTLELAGARTSSSCMQSIKSEADVILQRPNGDIGGISSLARALNVMETAYRNISSFFKYVLSAQIIRILLVALPMALGVSVLDARHILLCSFLLDLLVLLLFAFDKTPVPQGVIKYSRIRSPKLVLLANKRLALCAVGAGFGALVIPMAVNAIGIFGPYIYRVEYMFFAMIWIHIVLAYYIRYGSVSKIKFALKNKKLFALVASALVFVGLTLLFPQLGLAFEMVSHPLAYFLLSFLPAIIFSLCFEMTGVIKGQK